MKKENDLNIWNRSDFAMSGLGEKTFALGAAKHFIRCIKWSYQRVTCGFSDRDLWNMYTHLQKLLPAMLARYKETRNGSPSFLGDNYVDKNGILVNDTCHAEWDKILAKMIFLWRESREETCSKKNPYEKAHEKAREEFEKKYGRFGEKLQTEEEKMRVGMRLHFMNELPEYKEISEKYDKAERLLAKYRSRCKDKALDMLKKYFYALWD